MNIYFKKVEDIPSSSQLTFNGLGITQCFVKELSAKSDRDSILRTTHRHASYEVHIMISGSQDFEIENIVTTVSSGEFLLIPPYISHRALCETDDYKKLAIVFALSEESSLIPRLSRISSILKDNIPEKLLLSLDFLKKEQSTTAPFSEMVSELVVLECILLLLRFLTDKDAGCTPKDNDDARINMAKQFIKDNIQGNLSTEDVASYCYLGKKQLSRIFFRAEGCTVAEYIRVLKINRIKNLLANEQYSIRQISEIMNFSSEQYMSIFFKKQVGITPGEYRKSMLTS